MKRTYIFLTVIGLLAVAFTKSCQDKTLSTFTANVPVYMSYEDLRSGVSVSASRELNNPGAIYFKDNYIYINEYREGIHIIDLSDPSNPAEVSFITIPGNTSMAIKGDILYADSYVDLVLIDISNPANPSENNRIEDILTYTIPEYDYTYPLDEIDEEKGVVTGFEVKEITREVYPTYYPWPMYYEYDALSSSAVLFNGGGAATSGTEYGVAGSMATFLTYDNYLYLIQDQSTLKVIDIKDPSSVSEKYNGYIGWNLETMFIADGYMYIGSTTGMIILSLSNPASPQKKSTITHATSCDPVVVSGNYAYFTLRAGNFCGGTVNELDVVNISDKNNPNLIASYDMTEPYGLAVNGSTLFVCEGEHGMKVYDITDKYNIDDHRLAAFPEFNSTDIIAVNDLLFLIGGDGFQIYDASDINNISHIGSITVTDDGE